VTAPTTPVADAREEELLVVRCQLGERSAFDELIERWHPPLWKFVRRVTGDDDAAQDAVQDVWLRVLRGINRLRDGSKLRAWLFGIAHHVVTDRLRSQYASLTVDGIDLTNVAVDESSPGLEDDIATLRHELTQLPVTEREVLTLFYLRELSLVEVAEVLGVPVGTVKSRLFRARQLLRDELESKGRHA
jgi:RNA polymerase sigma-70 factor (ECF subfamily)